MTGRHCGLRDRRKRLLRRRKASSRKLIMGSLEDDLIEYTDRNDTNISNRRSPADAAFRHGYHDSLYLGVDTVLSTTWNTLVFIPDTLVVQPLSHLLRGPLRDYHQHGNNNHSSPHGRVPPAVTSRGPELLSQDRLDYYDKTLQRTNIDSKQHNPPSWNGSWTGWLLSMLFLVSPSNPAATTVADASTTTPTSASITLSCISWKKTIRTVLIAIMAIITFPVSLVLLPLFVLTQKYFRRYWRAVRPQLPKNGADQLRWIVSRITDQCRRFIRGVGRWPYLIAAGFLLRVTGHGQIGDANHRRSRQRYE